MYYHEKYLNFKLIFLNELRYMAFAHLPAGCVELL